uniref:Uncharacterized protein n=1 Tax=Ditylenchus dipsaci TaxID=166011 RepID=A0A915E6F2_9BILA
MFYTIAMTIDLKDADQDGGIPHPGFKHSFPRKEEFLQVRIAQRNNKKGKAVRLFPLVAYTAQSATSRTAGDNKKKSRTAST